MVLQPAYQTHAVPAASTAEELSSQAQMLSGIVNQFKLPASPDGRSRRLDMPRPRQSVSVRTATAPAPKAKASQRRPTPASALIPFGEADTSFDDDQVLAVF